MTTERRTALAVLAGVLTPGRTDLRGEGPDNDTPLTGLGPETPQCDPDDVTRPFAATGTNTGDREYPRKPERLTDQSVPQYLDGFETPDTSA